MTDSITEVQDGRAHQQREAFLARFEKEFDSAVAFNARCLAKQSPEFKRAEERYYAEWKRANEIDDRNKELLSLLEQALDLIDPSEGIATEIRIAVDR